MQHRTRNTRHTNKTLDCFCFNFNYASVQFRLEYDFGGLFLRCRMRGQPAAFAVSWRVIEPSAKSKHFTLPSQKKKKSQLKRTPAHCACACLQKQRSDGATELRSNNCRLACGNNSSSSCCTWCQGLYRCKGCSNPLSAPAVRMSQVIISSEGNSGREQVPRKSLATPQPRCDWLAISPASILPHGACAQGKCGFSFLLFFFIFGFLIFVDVLALMQDQVGLWAAIGGRAAAACCWLLLVLLPLLLLLMGHKDILALALAATLASLPLDGDNFLELLLLLLLALWVARLDQNASNNKGNKHSSGSSRGRKKQWPCLLLRFFALAFYFLRVKKVGDKQDGNGCFSIHWAGYLRT